MTQDHFVLPADVFPSHKKLKIIIIVIIHINNSATLTKLMIIHDAEDNSTKPSYSICELSSHNDFVVSFKSEHLASANLQE